MKNRKRILIVGGIITIILIAVIVFIISRPTTLSPGQTLRVVTQNWNGWVPSASTSSTDNFVINTEGQKLNIGTVMGGDDLILTVDKLSSDSVTFSTGSTSSIDVNRTGTCSSNNQSFTIKINEAATLGTCTMDAGQTWTLTYI